MRPIPKNRRVWPRIFKKLQEPYKRFFFENSRIPSFYFKEQSAKKFEINQFKKLLGTPKMGKFFFDLVKENKFFLTFT